MNTISNKKNKMVFVRSGMFVYCMKSTRHPGIFKIGISNDPRWRASWISKTMPGNAVVLFKFELYFAYQIEQLLHSIFRPLNVKDMKGSGKTEWFRPGLPIWIWIVLSLGVWYLFPGITATRDWYLYLGGFVLGAIVMPAVFFLGFVCAFLLMCKLIQELGILVALFLVLRFILQTGAGY